MSKSLHPMDCRLPCPSLSPGVCSNSFLNIHWKDWCWSWSSNTLAAWCEEPTHWKRPWCWERLKAGEGDNRGWDSWMASPAQWTWVWASSRSWWWTGRPGMLQSMGLQMFGYDWANELNYPTRTKIKATIILFQFALLWFASTHNILHWLLKI